MRLRIAWHRPGQLTLRVGWVAVAATLLAVPANSLPLPEDEIRFEFNHYIDNFGVSVLYPTLSFQHRLTGRTSASVRYVVDGITSASMQSRFDVDGITSATQNSPRQNQSAFDEVRQEIGAGIVQQVGSGTVSIHGLYGTEQDYRSRSILTTVTVPLAERNTELQLGLVRSWDEVFPVTRTWTRQKDTVRLNLGITQVLSRSALAQVTYTRGELDGFLSDPYQVVTILDPLDRRVRLEETRHPSSRSRHAIAALTKWMTTSNSTVEVGYRRYWDNWSVESNTAHFRYQHRFGQGWMTTGITARVYDQSRASFFAPSYSRSHELQTVDTRLDAARAYEFVLQGIVPGHTVRGLGLVQPESIDLDGSLSYYRRTTDTRDWHRRRRTLHAFITRIGFRLRY